MPSGPAHLHERFGDDWTAWVYLRRRGWRMSQTFNGVVCPPYKGYLIPECEWDAVVYLVQEWDWDLDRAGAPERPVERSRLHRCLSWLLRVSSGPLRVRDKHLRAWQMWWYCVAKYELRRRWYYVTGRREEWDEGGPILGDIAEARDKMWDNGVAFVCTDDIPLESIPKPEGADEL